MDIENLMSAFGSGMNTASSLVNGEYASATIHGLSIVIGNRSSTLIKRSTMPSLSKKMLDGNMNLKANGMFRV